MGSGICRACGDRSVHGAGNPLCERCTPMVCVCPIPDPDRLGECSWCLRAYRPDHPGIANAREDWVDYLTKHGISCESPRHFMDRMQRSA